jgi:subtilase family serine protease
MDILNTSVYYRLYFSEDSILDINDMSRQLYSYYYSTWYTQSVKNINQIITLPDSLTPGKYYIIAKIDAENIVFENNELNNISILPIQVAPPFYDLQAISVICKEIIVAGNTYSVLTDVKNNSPIKLEGINIGYYLSEDQNYDSSDLFLDDYNINSIKARSSGSYSKDVRLPADINYGMYYLFANIDYNDNTGEVNETNNLCITPVGILEPNLDFTVNTFQLQYETISNGGLIPAEYIISNQGSTTAASVPFVIILSTDQIYNNEDDTLLYSNIISSIQPSGYYSGSVNLSIPESIDTGSYFLFLIVDPEDIFNEKDQSNNQSVQSIKIIPATIDFEVRDPQISADTIVKEDQFSVSCKVYNNGSAYSTGARVGFFLSTDTLYSADDEFLTDFSMILNPGTSQQYTAYLRLDDVSPGEYNIILYADYPEQVNETDEGNNFSWVHITMIPSTIDLETRDPQISADTITENDQFSVSCKVYNNGSANSSGARIGFFLSTDTLYTADDKLLTYSNINLSAGASRQYSAYVMLTGYLEGQYYILMYADYQEAVDETDENNNLSWHRITIIPSDIDISILELTVNNGNNIFMGYQATVSYKITNTGYTISPASYTGFYISKDSIYSPLDDAFLGSDFVGEINPDNTSPESKSISFPVTVPEGEYWLISRANYDGSVPETDYSNNDLPVKIFMGQPIIDLVIAETYSENVYIEPGKIFSISCKVMNTGNIRTGSSSYLRYYLSTDTLFDENDIFLGSDYCGYIDPGQYSFEDIRVSMPMDLNLGENYILFICDYNNTVDEANEFNNVAYERVLFQKDGNNIYVSQLYMEGEYYDGTGGNYLIHYTVYNSDSTNIYNVFNGIYLSQDTLLSSEHSLLQYDSVAYLPSGTRIQCKSEIYIPPRSASNFGYIVVKIDYRDHYAELNETDNFAFIPIYPNLTMMPDLFIGVFSLENDSVNADEVQVYSCFVANVGQMNSADTKLELFLSPDAVLDESDEKISIEFLDAMVKYESIEVKGSFQFPADRITGWYYLIVSVDPENTIDEIVEDNNIILYAVYFSNPASLTEGKYNDKIKLFPIPAISEIHITIFDKSGAYRIISEQGRVEKAGYLKLGTNNIPVSDLRPGDYILIFYNEKGIFTKKFIVLD